jgi:murein DD-endopeptidase MepM/ murein hydrolase activator NlpD
MLKYTVRYAHLEPKAIWKPGDLIIRGRKIGTMGNSGKSTAPHLHIDCVEGEQPTNWRLAHMEDSHVLPSPRQLNWFIDNELFGVYPHITSYYNDPRYFHNFGKVHLAYDIVPIDRHDTKAHWDIYWNRSMGGKVLDVGYDNGYGNYILITFEA